MEHQEAVAGTIAERYLLRELSESERDRFEEHFFSCAECAQTIRDLEKLEANMKAAFAAPQPAAESTRSTSQARRGFFAWLSFRPAYAVAAACMLALLGGVVGYQVGNRGGNAFPQPVTAILLTPETRGDISVLSPKPSDRFLLLEADLPGATGRLEWVLTQAGSRKTVARGTGDAPQPGAPFNLLLSSSLLPVSDYQLEVQPTGARQAPWLFRFKVER